MFHREIREEVVEERRDTGYPGEIGSVNEGRRTIGRCTDLGCCPFGYVSRPIQVLP
jgi:hypothetical protein